MRNLKCEEARMNVGQRIREHREAAGLLQDDLAKSCYVSRQTISNWERNRTLPDIESLKRIAGTFGTTVDALIATMPPKSLSAWTMRRVTFCL